MMALDCIAEWSYSEAGYAYTWALPKTISHALDAKYQTSTSAMSTCTVAQEIIITVLTSCRVIPQIMAPSSTCFPSRHQMRLPILLFNQMFHYHTWILLSNATSRQSWHLELKAYMWMLEGDGRFTTLRFLMLCGLGLVHYNSATSFTEKKQWQLPIETPRTPRRWHRLSGWRQNQVQYRVSNGFKPQPCVVTD